MSTEANAQIISVIGGCRRAGRWLVPAKTKVMTFFGRATIDLREAETTADELAFDCMSAFASITFIVPEGAEVRPSGMAILASAHSDVPVDVGNCHLPKIAIDAVTLFGRFRIVTGEALEADQPDEAEQASAGVDLVDTSTAPVVPPAFVPPTDPAPFVPPQATPAPQSASTLEPEPAGAALDPASPEPAARRRGDGDHERSPIHHITVPNSPAAIALDERPGPLPAPTAAADEPGAVDPEADDAQDATADADAEGARA